MIRTDSVKLTAIEAIAYKQKILNGGGAAGLTVITKTDRAVVTIDKRTGDYIPYGKVDSAIFTEAVFSEAFNLTKSLPLKKQNSIKNIGLSLEITLNDDANNEVETGEDEVLASAEYNDFLQAYTNKKDKFDFKLMNKDLIQFAAKSTSVAKMKGEKRPIDEILVYIVGQKLNTLTKGRRTEDFVKKFIEVMDAMETRSAFKELKASFKPTR
ncbi:MAG: hypothetical protein FWD23_05810 [Oscillospiraceae bacterium]|nr:hypothetical protein [Oscillospiraceae bacterium]